MNQPRPQFTRRQFLHQGLTLASASLFVPHFLQASTLRLPHAAPGMRSIPGVPEDHVLVVLQLSGGNDGLNTVVPFASDLYRKARPGIAIPPEQALRLGRNSDIGLHPALARIKDMYDSGRCAILQGVGYPNPNRSHFKSMDIWHTADTSGTGTGWLGRYFDSACCGTGKGESGGPEAGSPPAVASNQPGIAIGRTAPLAMEGRRSKPIAFETPDLFRWTGQDVHDALNDPYVQLNSRAPADPAAQTNADFLLRTAVDAQVSSDLIRKAVRQRPLVEYPRSDIAQQLQMVSAMVRAGLTTRVYYVSHGGFDTHATQGGAQGNHANLLRQLAEAVDAFYRELDAAEESARVLTMCFSEFGRRVRQNASNGTDHGTAAPMMLFGPMVKPGLHGEHPSLADLDEGDLKFHTDFRSVYANVLGDWLGSDPAAVLQQRFKPTAALAT